ncbi:GNAT family N-acetyltransferase [Cryobacterium zongtaii]|uniref:GNAT family N-acetyltransferase n=1 Tax=Cryobacterium zongtaii TaxID=1259217 RepID=A0A2S3ZIM2_9MICO|nr:GNAT family N-acetyltransferase [Cryobacterium zongtaii]POH67448.1 GNAT family N-acetyltransferase [Cryobacterium zongtaii]
MTIPGESVTVRAYAPQDAPSTLAVFLDAVTTTASQHYSPEQIAAWSAPEERDVEEWNLARAGRGTVVAVVEGDVAGFSDVNADGYIDMMFVSPRFGRRGVASTLLGAIERRAKSLTAATLWTNASITARPFFEQHGFVVEAKQHPVSRGVRMTNYRMAKQLS